jgi:hypothetical protein
VTNNQKTINFISSRRSSDDERSIRIGNTLNRIIQSDKNLHYPDFFAHNTSSVMDMLYYALESADLVVIDLVSEDPSIMYDLGYAHGYKKPVILIADTPENVPFDVMSVPTLLFSGSDTEHSTFEKTLKSWVYDALRNPEKYSVRPKTNTSISSIFISYSHQDIEFLERLRIHLRPLERDRKIELWDDTKLIAGDRWKEEIQQALERSRAAILLISADFLASDFIVDNELPPILLKAQSEGTLVLSVIIKPCRFKREESLSAFQAVNDPDRPIISLNNSEQESIWDRVAQRVEQMLIK